MTPSEIQRALGERLATLGRPIVWPNKSAIAPAKPYLVFQQATRSDEDRALAGGGGFSQGRAVVVVVEDLNSFTTAADDLAHQVKALFPKALRLGGLTVRGSSVSSGYDDDVSWRVPVFVDWLAT